jgi:hypothetical protein
MRPGVIEAEGRILQQGRERTVARSHRQMNGGPFTGGPPSLVDQRIPPA